jgi:hypothetical protein
MNDLERRLESWKRYDYTREAERQRRAFLQQRPEKNPEHLTRLVKIKRVGRGFIANGKPVEMNEVVRVSYACARELVHIGKAIFVHVET